MIIYEFSTWGAYKSENGLFSVTEIEVEEKPKSYVEKHTRINKSDINKLQTSYGNRMFRLDADEQAYISAMIEQRKMKVASEENSLNILKAELKKWEALKEGVQG